jgi:integrase
MAGQIIKKADGKWLVKTFLGRDPQGKKKYFSKLINGNKKDAQNYLNRTLTEMSQGSFVAPTPKTLNEYLDDWLKNAASQKLSERTYGDYVYNLKQYVRAKLGLKKLSSISPLDLQELYTELRARKLSPRTVQIVHNILNSAFKQAVKWRVLQQNPAQYVDRPKQVRKEMAALSPGEVTQFLKVAKDDAHFLYFSLAIDTGARPSELLALQWSDIDFEQHKVTIQRSLDYQDYGCEIRFIETKTSRSRRSIHISPSNSRLLREYKRRQAEQRLKAGDKWQPFNLVFSTSEGLPLQRRNILRRHLRPILKTAELPEIINLYSLRHTCATLLLIGGVNPKVVSERLGHASIVLTLDTYSHVLPSLQKDAADKMEMLLFATADTPQKVDTPLTHQNEKATNLVALSC